MYDRLKNGKALPLSRFVRVVPRGGTPTFAPNNVSPIKAEPAAADPITFSRPPLFVPT